MDNLIEPKLKRTDHWLRLLLALVNFGLVFNLVMLLVGIALVMQFILVAFLGKTNGRLIGFTRDLNRFSYHVLQFVTWNSNYRPFPFSDWPGPEIQHHTDNS